MKNKPNCPILDNGDAHEALLIHDIARLMRRNFDRQAKRLGLTRTQWMVVATLRRFPGMKQAELAERMEVEPITVARIIDRMEKDGWIERRLDARDRRVKRLHLTNQIQPLAAEFRELAISMRAEALSGVTQSEYDLLMQVLGKMKTNLCH